MRTRVLVAVLAVLAVAGCESSEFNRDRDNQRFIECADRGGSYSQKPGGYWSCTIPTTIPEGRP